MTHTIELRGVWHHTHQRNASLAPGALIDRFYPRVLEALSQCLDQLRTHALDQWYSLYAHVNDYESQLKQLQDAHASDAVLDDQLDNEGRVVRQCVIATLATLAAYFVSSQ